LSTSSFRRTTLTGSAFAAMFFLGVSTAIIGAAARNIGLTPVQIGLLLTGQNFGFIVAVLIGGALADVWPKTRLLLIGSIAMAAGFFLFFADQAFWLNFLIAVLLGGAIGLYEASTDALLLEIHHARQSRYIGLNHLAATLGMGGITAYLIFLDLHWRRSLIEAGAAVLALAVLFALVRSAPAHNGDARFWRRLRELPHKPLAGALVTATILAVGAELAAVGYLTSFLMEMRGFDQAASKVGLLLFLGGIAGGRLLMGLLANNAAIPRLLVTLFGLAALSFAGLFFLPGRALIYPLIVAAGLSLSALCPLLIAVGGLLYPQHYGAVIGMIKTGIPLGGMIVPFFITLLARQGGMALALWIFPVVCLGGLGLILALTVAGAFAALSRESS